MKVKTNTLTATQKHTSVETVPTTYVGVFTQAINRTKIFDYTLTATETKNLTNIYTHTNIKTDTVTVTKTDVRTVIQPTIYVKTYDVTTVIDNVIAYASNQFPNFTNSQMKAMVETATAIVTDKVTYLQTAIKTETMTNFMTVTAISMVVQPTTYVKTWVSTQTQDKFDLIASHLVLPTSVITNILAILSAQYIHRVAFDSNY